MDTVEALVESVNVRLSYEDLYRDNFRTIATDVFFILGDRGAAVEVTQDAFAKAYVNWTKLETYERPGAWVRRVAIRMAVRNRFRRFKEQEHYETDVSYNQNNDEYLDLRDAIAKLPRSQKAAIVLHYYRDLAVEDVASYMGCKMNTVKVHLHNARARLREILTTKEQ